MTWVQLFQALDLAWKVGAVLLGVFVMRRKLDDIGRESLEKSLSILRSQIADRDMADIAQRERLNSLSGQVRDINAEIERKEARIMALLDENFQLKRERDQWLSQSRRGGDITS